ncbi:Alternative oxidase [Gracilaria domingensis]|nr:Alternative oxidase [Gracilaria domingensis]
MKVTNPSVLERGLVVLAQGLYLTFYSALYLTSPRAAHRLTGYLEEEAHRAYTEYLACIDNGILKNKPAPQIAKNYYHLPDNATMRDVILHVRADEAMHRDVNHHFGNKYRDGDTDSPTISTDPQQDDIGKRM